MCIIIPYHRTTFIFNEYLKLNNECDDRPFHCLVAMPLARILSKGKTYSISAIHLYVGCVDSISCVRRWLRLIASIASMAFIASVGSLRAQ